jgi:putative intracellular protease/amidase
VLRAAAARGARIASVCTGAFVLAAAGLLDGHRATTHWEDAADLARRYPHIDVDPNVLYVDNGGRLLTSAGPAHWPARRRAGPAGIAGKRFVRPHRGPGDRCTPLPAEPARKRVPVM